MKELIETFYSAFKNQDAESMVACYHDDVVFEDPAFGVLRGDRAKNMWRMLIASQKGKDFKVDFSDINSNGNTCSANWEARYDFSKTGRPVHNKILANFEFKDGKIIKHIDVFNLHKWSKQALGFKGSVMGGTRYFKTKLQHQTNHLLTKFETTL